MSRLKSATASRHSSKVLLVHLLQDRFESDGLRTLICEGCFGKHQIETGGDEFFDNGRISHHIGNIFRRNTAGEKDRSQQCIDRRGELFCFRPGTCLPTNFFARLIMPLDTQIESRLNRGIKIVASHPKRTTRPTKYIVWNLSLWRSRDDRKMVDRFR